MVTIVTYHLAPGNERGKHFISRLNSLRGRLVPGEVVRSARKKGYNNGASAAAALLANGMGNTVTASGPRPQLRSSRNSAHFRTGAQSNKGFIPSPRWWCSVRPVVRPQTQSPQARE